MSDRSVSHDRFVIERSFNAPPPRVFQAFADPAAKARWFKGPTDWGVSRFESDFRVGGKEVNSGGPKGGPVHSFEATYYDIVPDERIIFAYEMELDGKRISVSLTTVELAPEAAGTRMRFTEQDVFLDGWDNVDSREEGTREL